MRPAPKPTASKPDPSPWDRLMTPILTRPTTPHVPAV